MPEIPELQHVAAVLQRRLHGRTLQQIEIDRPIVLRATRDQLDQALIGAQLDQVQRSGKFLLLHWRHPQAGHHILAVAPMLNGRFQFTADAKPHARTCFSLHFDSPDCNDDIRYIDERFLGKAYLARPDTLDQVPVLSEQGPDALDPALDRDAFLQRLKRYRGQVKNVLVNHKFIAGIGNAYADEILWNARIHPFSPVAKLAPDRRADLYQALRDTLDWACPEAAALIGERIDRKPRDFLNVHRKGGQPCPRCGADISELSPNRRITSFCRPCQPA